MPEGLLWTIVVVTFVLGAFFSGSETAFLAADRIRLRHRASEGDRRARTALRFADNPEFFLSTVLVGTNLSVIGCTTTATAIATRHFGDSGSAVATLVLVPIILVFNEIIPKGVFLYYSDRAAVASARSLSVMAWVLYPVVRAFTTATDWLTGAFPSESGRRKLDVTLDELMLHLTDSSDAGLISPETRRLAMRAVELRSLTIEAIMVPLERVVMVERGSGRPGFEAAFIKSGYSRLPVYDGERRDIVGVVSVHEFLGLSGDVAVFDAIKAPFATEPGGSVVDVFVEMKELGQHLSVVVDGERRAVGIVTMEDILERLVGAIVDEFN